MTQTTALAFLLPVLGGAVPAGVAALVALLGQRQLARAEWHKRLEKALELIVHAELTQQQIGQELLTDLMTSRLGSESDRALASNIATTAVRAALTIQAHQDVSKVEDPQEVQA